LQIELLLAHLLQMPRLKLYLNFNHPLNQEQLDTLRQLVQRRGAREPLQQILGSACFCGLELIVTPEVLVPRPETELLAERAWEFLRQRAGENGSASLTVLDFGTGSGCLAVTLAAKVPQAQVHAVDISEAALNVARQNATRHGVAERI
jgi:release factor glutamine methyltransferase